MRSELSDIYAALRVLYEQEDINIVQWDRCNHPGVRRCVESGLLNLNDLRYLSENAANALIDEGVNDFVRQGHISKQQILSISYEGRFTLYNEAIRNLIIGGYMLLDTALRGINLAGRRALMNPDNLRRIQDREATAADVVTNAMKEERYAEVCFTGPFHRLPERVTLSGVRRLTPRRGIRRG